LSIDTLLHAGFGNPTFLGHRFFVKRQSRIVDFLIFIFYFFTLSWLRLIRDGKNKKWVTDSQTYFYK